MGKKTSTAGVGPVKIVWHGPDSADQKTSGKNMGFFVFANPEMVDKWRSDKSVPLIEVVDSFDIFEVGNSGNIGVFSHPSKQALENAFNTSNDAEVIQRILTEGTVQAENQQPMHISHFPQEIITEIGNNLANSVDCKTFRAVGRFAAHALGIKWLLRKHILPFRTLQDCGGEDFALCVFRLPKMTNTELAREFTSRDKKYLRSHVDSLLGKRNADALFCVTEASCALEPDPATPGGAAVHEALYEWAMVSAKAGWFMGCKTILERYYGAFQNSFRKFEGWCQGCILGSPDRGDRNTLKGFIECAQRWPTLFDDFEREIVRDLRADDSAHTISKKLAVHVSWDESFTQCILSRLDVDTNNSVCSSDQLLTILDQVIRNVTKKIAVTDDRNAQYPLRSLNAFFNSPLYARILTPLLPEYGNEFLLSAARSDVGEPGGMDRRVFHRVMDGLIRLSYRIPAHDKDTIANIMKAFPSSGVPDSIVEVARAMKRAGAIANRDVIGLVMGDQTSRYQAMMQGLGEC
ncbi:hypothetical protein HDV00_001346 [Rhizophlyctis rosea]|nr:hypothetical protein HDV00_001346 [Rhizophlyctis rosea]